MPKLPAPPARYDAIDALRGFALVWMTLYHFCFDLNNFGLARFDFYRDPLWTLQRTAILSLFLLCVGLGQSVAVQQHQSWLRFWKRWARVAGCALLVSVGSWWMFPDSYIYFGVLHGMALMLVIARLTAGAGRWLWVSALLALLGAWVAPLLLAGSSWSDAFNAPMLNWIGIITRKPVTEDYVPLLPWMGVVWLGVWAGMAGSRSAAAQPAWQASGAWAGLTWLGRRSLVYYMLHQPVMIGILWLLLKLRP
ncbi:MAG: heparan-alpha-glucosaminide N-acetyltransferase [Burkholderiaceae bacterium]